MPLICQPGAEWNYSRSTDILGRIIEVVSGKSLGAFLTERILAPLQMAETAFHTGEENAGRLAEPFATDPWTGDKVQLFNMLEKPVMESGGGGLVSTTMDYARFCQMLLNGGTLDGNRIIGRKTLELMASDHLGPERQGQLAADAGRPRLWSRLRRPHPCRHGAVPGLASASSSGAAWPARSSGSIPKEELFAVFMMQGPGQREYIRTMLRNLVYAAVE